LGGAIENLGDLTLNACTIANNVARLGGGIDNRGMLTVTNSILSGNCANLAGGIDNVGTLAMTNSTVSGNSGGYGGGVANGGEMSVTGSTISGNASNFGGGLFNFLGLSVTNSTISGNSAYVGGGIYNYDSLSVTNSTITGNSGGGLFDWSVRTTLVGSIVGGNTLSDGVTPNDLSFYMNVVLSSHHNLIGPGGSGGLENGVNGNIVVAAVADLHLGPLADNGGPTLTHALLLGSPAIDAGDPEFAPPPAFDQRGAPYARVDLLGGQRIDIGAYELHPRAALAGDYDGDRDVDGADFLAWQRGLGGSVVPYTGADGNGDCIVDGADGGVWHAYFGQTIVGQEPAAEDVNARRDDALFVAVTGVARTQNSATIWVLDRALAELGAESPRPDVPPRTAPRNHVSTFPRTRETEAPWAASRLARAPAAADGLESSSHGAATDAAQPSRAWSEFGLHRVFDSQQRRRF
jgi:hypothetical protein